MVSSTSPVVSCTSLGMVIIDEIHMPNRPPLIDVLGGSASFVALGQRLFAKSAAEVGCLLIVGDDFPANVKMQIGDWDTMLVVKMRSDKRSSRGKLVYEDNTFGPKKFTYTGEPLRATPTDLIDTPLLQSKAFHFFGTPEEILTQVPELLRLRKNAKIEKRPFICWEPLPASCNIKNQHSFLDACKLVDLFSPNHIELISIFEKTPTPYFDVEKLESYTQELLDSSVSPTGNGFVIVRAAEHGTLSMSRISRPTWLPSYYPSGSLEVVDPTGAGNTFLGGYIAGWQRMGDVHEATCYGHVAASFALEQIGLPELERVNEKVVCNGNNVIERLKVYKKRLSEAEVKSEGIL